MALVKANLFSVAAAALVALMLVGWGFGKNGDPEFAAQCAGVAGAVFALGLWARSWWTVAAISIAWFVGWMLTANLLAPDTYMATIAFGAPGPAIFVALGTGAGRSRRAGTPKTEGRTRRSRSAARFGTVGLRCPQAFKRARSR